MDEKPLRIPHCLTHVLNCRVEEDYHADLAGEWPSAAR